MKIQIENIRDLATMLKCYKQVSELIEETASTDDALLTCRSELAVSIKCVKLEGSENLPEGAKFGQSGE